MSDKNKAASAVGASALAFEPSGSSAASFAPALVTEPNAPITLRNFDALVTKPALDLRSVLLDSSALVPVRDIGMLGGPLVPNPKLDIISILFSGERARSEAAAAGQWHIVNTNPGQLDLNIGTIWDDYTGRGVRIGVYDSGIESTHPDLNDNYNARLEFAGDNPGPDYTVTDGSNDGHGTAVAGIIAAEQNGSGAVGIAYSARITSVDTVGASAVSNWTDFENDMARFDIVNRSSGAPNFAQFQRSGTVTVSGNSVDYYEYLTTSYENAVTNGRGGRGTIIVESANNDRAGPNGAAVGATVPSNGDANSDLANNGHFTIVVGSVDQNGNVDNYSSPGANLLVSAFGTAGNANSVVTTDLVGANGYNTSATAPPPGGGLGGDYTTTFNGTSAATPMVTGIVALMLEANPMLGWRDVQNILALSARQVGSEIGAAPTPPEEATTAYDNWSWGENKADNWNGGGMHFSNDYGYGLVDAHAAVRLAESWTLQSNSSNQQVGVGTWFGNQVTLTEANTLPNEFRFTITDDISTESIGLWMNLQHQRMSDLRIEIRSPEGTWSTLSNRTGLGGQDFALTGNLGWTFTSNAFRGEMARGDWVVRVWDTVDSGANDDGTVSQLILRTYGSAPTVNDQLYYTDEYSDVWSRAISLGDFGRLQITDTDGGIDTINASATSTEAVINLEQGGITLIAGGYAQVAMGSVIENAFGGDGHDTLHGNAQTNLLDGNRGNDTLYGKGGRDSLSGDKGDDLLVGGALGDHINGGSGKDTASYEGSRWSVTVSLGDQQGGVWNGTATGGDANGDSLYYVENVTGSRWGDRLTGNAEDNVLDGGRGADKMWGGRGNDTYYVDNASDMVDETEYVGSSGGSGMLRFSGYRDTGGTDTVVTTLATYDLSDVGANIPSLRALFPDTLYGTIENLTYSGTSSFTGTGNTADNVIRGGSASDALAGGEGHDTLYGGLGNDGLDLGLGNDKAYIDNGTAEGGDVVNAAAGGYDSVYADDSTVASGLHLNLWAAGTGYTPDVNKVAFTSAAIAVDYVEGNAGNDVIDGSRLSEGIVIAGGRGDDTLTGGSGSDGLVGGDNNDTLRGGLGNDGFDLGLGNDHAYIDNGTAEGGDVVYGTEGGYDTVYADDNTRATGLRLNLFRAGTGYTADVNRVALTSAAIAIDKVVGNTGNDLVDASRLAAGDYVEFAGGAGDDRLVSGLSSETFDGETDVDTIVYDGARTDYVIGTLEIRGGRSVVTIEHTASGATDYLRNVERAIFRSDGAETVVELDHAVGRNIVGTEAGETLTGTELGDTIDARGGNDTLIGAAGADTLLGAAGEDIVIVDNADAKIDGGEGYDYVAADASTAAEGFRIDLAGTNVEYVDGSSGGDTFDASGAVTGTLVEINGNAGNDTAREGPVEVWFDGGEGTDTFVLAGNLADYTLHADSGGWAGWTMIVHNATGAADWTIGVENLQFADQTIADPTAGHHALGTDAVDILAGTDGMDTLRGGLGADELRAGAGNDALYVDNTDTIIDGGEGWDVVYVNEAANQSGLTLEMAGKNVEYVWSGLGNDTINTRGLEDKANFWYGVESHAGNDIVLAGDAAISFSGGSGRDKLVLSGHRADYDIGVPQPDVDPTAVTVTNKATGVVDWIYSVETLQFADNTYATRELLV